MYRLELCLEYSLDDSLSRDLAVGSLWDDERTRAFDDIVGDDHVAAHRQAVHEVGIVGHSHLTVADSP